MNRFVVIVAPEGSNTWAIISPSFSTFERARGWAKERAEFNARHGAAISEFTVAEIVQLETVKWEGGDA